MKIKVYILLCYTWEQHLHIYPFYLRYFKSKYTNLRNVEKIKAINLEGVRSNLQVAPTQYVEILITAFYV